MSALLSLIKIAKSFNDFNALTDISFELSENDSLVIVGPSGSGKTTLLRLIAGLELPDKGEIHLGQNLVSKSGWALAPNKRELGFVFQTPSLWPHMTVRDNIMFGLKDLPKDEAQQRISYLLNGMSLSELAKRYPDQLSGGEARRVSIARALAPRPKLLLMDEPLTNLDTELKITLLELIKKNISGTGTSLIYVTHDNNEAKAISNRVMVLKGGVLAG